MNLEQYDEFCELWIATHEAMAGGKSFSGAALEMIFEDLEEYPLEVIKAALRKFRKSEKFAPTPFDIITMIKAQYGLLHIGVEEAWAIAQGFADEHNTVIATPEIFAAWGIAENTDRYSQAKAFKEKYSELMKTESRPQWRVYEGSPMPVAGDYPRQPVLFNPERLKSLADYDRLAFNNRLALSAPPETTMKKLIEDANKKTGNVVDLQLRFAMLKEAINGGLSLKKSPKQLAKRHEKWIRKVAKQNIATLKESSLRHAEEVF